MYLHKTFVYREVGALIILKAQVSAYGHVFAIASIFMFIGAIVALFIRSNKIKNKK